MCIDIAEALSGSVPCTACRYCCPGCPVGLEIPTMMSMVNELEIGGTGVINIMMRYTALGDGKRAGDCIACGQCREACPQKIDVPAQMERLAELVSKQRTWEEICREREAAAKAGSV